MNDPSAPVRVAALYKFTRLDDCEALRGQLARVCLEAIVKGTLLLAGEGINARSPARSAL
jgi:UPF0176 protein